MRDEDLRADRQFRIHAARHGASFVTQDDVMAFVSHAVLNAAEAATGVRPGPIESMTWTAALDLYGTDKPDLRFGMKLCDLSEVFAATDVKAFGAPTVKALRSTGRRGTLSQPPRRIDRRGKELGAKGLAWFRITSDGLDSPLAAVSLMTRRVRRFATSTAPRSATWSFASPTSTSPRAGPRRVTSDARIATGGRRTAPLRLGHRVSIIRGHRRRGQPAGGASPLHHAPSR